MEPIRCCLLLAAITSTLISYGKPVNKLDIIPCPLEVTAGRGTFNMERGRVKYITDNTLAEEEYRISVKHRSAKVWASGEQGFKMARQTLRQIETNDGRALMCCEIKDRPRFSYRGVMLDCARHFYPKEEILKILDVMAYYRLNRFHWHLTDDHGWRLEIRKYPRLIEVGAFGNIGSQPAVEDPNLTGEVRIEGYYTQDDVREIVAYADSLGITVVPEIDMPGHMTAALAAYPELGCTGGPYEVINFEGPRGKGFGKENLCIGKESVFTFLEDVFKEVLELFPSEYIHIGGDECITERWNNCPLCQRRVAEEGIVADEELSTGKYLQNYFTRRVQKMLEGYGRKIIGWDEILDGELDTEATIMSWRGSRGGIKAAKKGMKAIMSPSAKCYFDKIQSAEVEKEPRSFSRRILSVDSVYFYNPVKDLTEEEAENVIGVQANLWCDVVSTSEYVEYMLLPRLAAMSEVQWCDPGKLDWERFRNALDSHARFYEKNGYVYAKHLWGTIGLPGHEFPAGETAQ